MLTLMEKQVKVIRSINLVRFGSIVEKKRKIMIDDLKFREVLGKLDEVKLFLEEYELDNDCRIRMMRGINECGDSLRKIEYYNDGVWFNWFGWGCMIVCGIFCVIIFGLMFLTCGKEGIYD